MPPYRLGIDVDGVIANWTAHFHRTLLDVSGRPDEALPLIDRWDWPTAVGFTPQHEAESRQIMRTSDTWWASIPPYPWTAMFLRVLYVSQHDVYFITHRSGHRAHAQTCDWLSRHGYRDSPPDHHYYSLGPKTGPNVLLSVEDNGRSLKGHLARGLSLTHFIDDKYENCLDVKTQSPTTHVFLLASRQNLDAHNRAHGGGIQIISHVEEFLTVVGL